MLTKYPCLSGRVCLSLVSRDPDPRDKGKRHREERGFKAAEITIDVSGGRRPPGTIYLAPVATARRCCLNRASAETPCLQLCADLFLRLAPAGAHLRCGAE